jgi:hypothetical protein
MSTIQNNLSSLAQSLASLSAQTQSAPAAPADDSSSSGLSLAQGTDTLTLSAGSSAGDLDATASLIARQNLASVLADPASALAANQSAASLIVAQPDSALTAQGSPSGASVLNLIAEA